MAAGMLGWCICTGQIVLGITSHAWRTQTEAGAASLAHAHLSEAAMVSHNVDVIKLCQQGHLQTACGVLLSLPAAGRRKTRHCFSFFQTRPVVTYICFGE